MAAARNLKLGLFALAVIAATIVAGVVLGIKAMRPAVVMYHTYFDESVQGLELGAPVKYRGVRIGSVADITIAPDRKIVDVELALRERDAGRLGLAENAPGLRAQLGLQGLTGLKFIDIDFFDPARDVPPALAFPPAERYVPSRRSMMKGLLDTVESIGQHLPAVLDRATATLDRLDGVLDDIRDQRVAAKLSDAVEQAGLASAEVRRLVRHLDQAQIPAQLSGALAKADDAIAKVRGVLDGVGGDRGLVASARRASDSIADLGRNTMPSADELAHTIRELGDAARAFRELVEQIDRDPDMLVKGRARTKRP